MALLAPAGGVIFNVLHLPLPWMLGPLTILAVAGKYIKGLGKWPLELRNVAMIVLGVVMGNPFTAEAAQAGYSGTGPA